MGSKNSHMSVSILCLPCFAPRTPCSRYRRLFCFQLPQRKGVRLCLVYSLAVSLSGWILLAGRTVDTCSWRCRPQCRVAACKPLIGGYTSLQQCPGAPVAAAGALPYYPKKAASRQKQSPMCSFLTQVVLVLTLVSLAAHTTPHLAERLAESCGLESVTTHEGIPISCPSSSGTC